MTAGTTTWGAGCRPGPRTSRRQARGRLGAFGCHCPGKRGIEGQAYGARQDQPLPPQKRRMDQPFSSPVDFRTEVALGDVRKLISAFAAVGSFAFAGIEPA